MKQNRDPTVLEICSGRIFSFHYCSTNNAEYLKQTSDTILKSSKRQIFKKFQVSKMKSGRDTWRIEGSHYFRHTRY